MCIICIKPQGTQLPSYETRRQMWRRNPDGAGLMYCKDGSVRIEKGFMAFEQMETRLAELQGEIDVTATPIIMHYRITTHGGTCPQLTHPFPLSASPKALRTTHIRTTTGIAHNGIIPINTRPGLSDTAEYIADVLAKLPRGFYQSKKARKRIEREINGSRLAFLDGAGTITKIGHWLKGDDGCYYSNGSYIAPTPISLPKGFGTHQYTLMDILNAQEERDTRSKRKAKPAPRTYFEDGLLDEDGNEWDQDDEVEAFREWLRNRD